MFRLPASVVIAFGCVSWSVACPPTEDATAPGAPGSGEIAPPTMVDAPDRPGDPRFGLLTPIPDRGAVPPIVDIMSGPTAEELEFRARAREYRQQIRKIRHEYLGVIKVAEIRARGLEQLREFTDPAALIPLIEETAREPDDVRLAILNHLAAQGDHGQAALAHTAIHDKNPAIRHEAMTRLTSPASGPVLAILDSSLRSQNHEIANNAGILSGQLDALQTIPLLIFAQATADQVEEQGDIAWIAIQTQEAFVANLVPVVGDNSGAFQPVLGVVSSGVVLRIVDAVVVNYRTDIHNSLVNLTTEDWGQPTEHLAYDMKAWWEWYNKVYVPFKNEQARIAALSGGSAGGEPAQPPGMKSP